MVFRVYIWDVVYGGFFFKFYVKGVYFGRLDTAPLFRVNITLCIISRKFASAVIQCIP